MTGLSFVIDHLWQSTVFAGVVALMALALRRKRASIRYALWLAASIKFLVPFAALGAMGAAIGARVPIRLPQTTVPVLTGLEEASSLTASTITPAIATAAETMATTWWPTALLTVWGIGAVAVLGVWAVRWSRAARLVRESTPLDTGREVELLRRLEASFGHRPMPIRASDGNLEPAVFGGWRPVLLWPRAMSHALSDAQIETILIHELGHVRRHDNLMAMVHTAVQALFWFHPLVWWIEQRLVDEREQACDEEVVRLGRDRQVYAESLLKTCQFCVEAPVTCVSGVTGADLKRRVTRIMSAPLGGEVGLVTRAALVVGSLAVLSAPVIGGAAGVPQLTGTGLRLPDPSFVFEASSVRQNTSGERGSGWQANQGRLTIRNMSLAAMLPMAFRIQPNQIVGGPGWLSNDRFDVLARAEASTTDGALRDMLQNMLIERFAMKVRVETRSLPIYALVLARADGRLGPDLVEAGASGSGSVGSGRGTGVGRGVGGGVVGARASGSAGASTMGMRGLTMAVFAEVLSRSAGRIVVDRTGLAGAFDVSLSYANPSVVAAGGPSDAPELFTALQEQLGLKLEATRGPVEVLVIDSAEHPVNDNFEMPEPVRAIPPPPPGAQ